LRSGGEGAAEYSVINVACAGVRRAHTSPFYLDLSSRIRGRGASALHKQRTKEKARAECLRLFSVYIFRLSNSTGNYAMVSNFIFCLQSGG
jgi:hypothetical protein